MRGLGPSTDTTTMEHAAERFQRRAGGGYTTVVHLTITSLSLEHEKLGYFVALALHFAAGLPLLNTHRFYVVGVPVAGGRDMRR